MKTLLFLVVIVLFSTDLVYSADGNCAPLFTEISIHNTYIIQNKFNTGRGLSQDWEKFSFSQTSSLEQITRALPQGSTWIDMGAGQAKALKQALALNPNIQNGIAIGYKKPKAFVNYPSPRFSYIDGAFVENMHARGQLTQLENKTDLITDYYGPIAYSENLPLLFQVYFDLLKPGGVLMFNFNSTRSELNEYFLVNSVLVDNYLSEDGIVRWLKTIPGIEVEEVIMNMASPKEILLAIKVKKVSEKVIVPHTLITKKYLSGNPPGRIFSFNL